MCASADGEITSTKTAKWHFNWKITPRKVPLFACEVCEYQGSPGPAEPLREMTRQVGDKAQ